MAIHAFNFKNARKKRERERERERWQYTHSILRRPGHRLSRLLD
jgi:hypothetical protein